MRRLTIFLALLLLSQGACVRAGFDGVNSADSSQQEAGTNPTSDIPPRAGDHNLSAANDTCAAPLEIDLAPLARGESVTITVDPADTQGDYGGCVAETVVRLINVPVGGNVETQCLGGGDFALWYGNAGSCPDANDQYVGVNCDIIPVGINLALDPLHVFVCRDPAQGPMTWVLSPD